jgi:hypothetical protein
MSVYIKLLRWCGAANFEEGISLPAVAKNAKFAQSSKRAGN